MLLLVNVSRVEHGISAIEDQVVIFPAYSIDEIVNRSNQIIDNN